MPIWKSPLPSVGALLLATLLLGACHKASESTSAETTATAHIIPKPPSPAPIQNPVPGLQLPASFRGTLYCADCRGIDTYLELRNDHSYLLEERYLGSSDDNGRHRYTMGHFVLAGDRLRLQARADAMRYWQVFGPRRLRELNPAGRPLPGDNTVLMLDDEPVLGSGHLLLRGHYVFTDDTGFFRECETNHSWPVATAGASEALDRAYNNAITGDIDDGVVFLTAEAHLVRQPAATGNHSEEALVIDRVIDLNHDEDCKTPR